jgi:RNA polymerase sigma-70 factor (ECF subfamily)
MCPAGHTRTRNQSDVRCAHWHCTATVDKSHITSETRDDHVREAGPERAREMSGACVGRVDVDPLRALHDEHARALFSYVIGLTAGDRSTAQDVVQETLLRAWRNLAALEQGSGSLRGWLFTVARRIVIDEWRAASRRPTVVTDQVPEPAVGDTAEQSADRQLVLSALRTLSTDHRRVLFECYFRDASVADAAETLGVPAGTVKSRTHAALHALRLAIDSMGGVA